MQNFQNQLQLLQTFLEPLFEQSYFSQKEQFIKSLCEEGLNKKDLLSFNHNQIQQMIFKNLNIPTLSLIWQQKFIKFLDEMKIKENNQDVVNQNINFDLSNNNHEQINKNDQLLEQQEKKQESNNKSIESSDNDNKDKISKYKEKDYYQQDDLSKQTDKSINYSGNVYQLEDLTQNNLKKLVLEIKEDFADQNQQYKKWFMEIFNKCNFRQKFCLRQLFSEEYKNFKLKTPYFVIIEKKQHRCKEVRIQGQIKDKNGEIQDIILVGFNCIIEKRKKKKKKQKKKKNKQGDSETSDNSDNEDDKNEQQGVQCKGRWRFNVTQNKWQQVTKHDEDINHKLEQKVKITVEMDDPKTIEDAMILIENEVKKDKNKTQQEIENMLLKIISKHNIIYENKEQITKLVTNCRKKFASYTPKDINQLNTLTQNGDKFVRHHQGEEGNLQIYACSDQQLEVLFSKETYVQSADSFAKIKHNKTDKIYFQQLFVIMAVFIEYDCAIPVFFSLMEKKNQDSYERCIHQFIGYLTKAQSILEVANELKPTIGFLDCEQAQLYAFQNSLCDNKFYNTWVLSMHICSFHYAQMLWRKISMLGGRKKQNLSTSFQLINHLRLLQFIPPQELEIRYLQIKSLYDHQTYLKDFFKYFYDGFIGKQCIAKVKFWNYYILFENKIFQKLSITRTGVLCYTNNFIENLNKQILSQNGNDKHVPYKKLLETLSKIEYRKMYEFKNKTRRDLDSPVDTSDLNQGKILRIKMTSISFRYTPEQIEELSNYMIQQKLNEFDEEEQKSDSEISKIDDPDINYETPLKNDIDTDDSNTTQDILEMSAEEYDKTFEWDLKYYDTPTGRKKQNKKLILKKILYPEEPYICQKCDKTKYMQPTSVLESQEWELQIVCPSRYNGYEQCNRVYKIKKVYRKMLIQQEQIPQFCKNYWLRLHRTKKKEAKQKQLKKTEKKRNKEKKLIDKYLSSKKNIKL